MQAELECTMGQTPSSHSLSRSGSLQWIFSQYYLKWQYRFLNQELHIWKNCSNHPFNHTKLQSRIFFTFCYCFDPSHTIPHLNISLLQKARSHTSTHLNISTSFLGCSLHFLTENLAIKPPILSSGSQQQLRTWAQQLKFKLNSTVQVFLMHNYSPLNIHTYLRQHISFIMGLPCHSLLPD